MRALGIDPGYDRLGVAIIEKPTGTEKETVIFSTCVETDSSADLATRLVSLETELQQIIDTYAPEIIGIETLFFNKNIKTALKVAHARGVILHTAARAHLHIIELSPQQIKVAVTGYGNSDKHAVTTMVQQLADNVPKTAHDDEYDAIAAGITALAHYR